MKYFILLIFCLSACREDSLYSNLLKEEDAAESVSSNKNFSSKKSTKKQKSPKAKLTQDNKSVVEDLDEKQTESSEESKQEDSVEDSVEDSEQEVSSTESSDLVEEDVSEELCHARGQVFSDSGYCGKKCFANQKSRVYLDTKENKCKLLTVCSRLHYQTIAPSITSDRKCVLLTTCNGSYEFRAPSKTSDRICSDCSIDEYNNLGECSVPSKTIHDCKRKEKFEPHTPTSDSRCIEYSHSGNFFNPSLVYYIRVEDDYLGEGNGFLRYGETPIIIRLEQLSGIIPRNFNSHRKPSQLWRIKDLNSGKYIGLDPSGVVKLINEKQGLLFYKPRPASDDFSNYLFVIKNPTHRFSDYWQVDKLGDIGPLSSKVCESSDCTNDSDNDLLFEFVPVK